MISVDSSQLLFFCSEGDRLVNPKCTKAIAKKYHAKLLIHKDAGHDLPLDASEWLASKVAPFISSD